MSGELDKPKIAIALAVYNGVKWLPEQMKSILNQRGVEVEVFVSIDLSTDDSESMCKRMAEEDNRIHLLPLGTRFGEASKNFFRLIRDIDIARFDYFSFADQDDIWMPHKLIYAVNYLENYNYQGYSSDVIAFWKSGKTSLVKKSYTQSKWDYLFEGGGPGCTFVINNQLFSFVKETVIENWKDVNLLGYHDWFVYALARANGFRWVIDTSPYLLYRQHDRNHTGVNQGIRALKARYEKVISGWGIKQAFIIAKIVGKDKHPFIQMWSRMDRISFLRLSLHSYSCRRKWTEKIYFFLACIILAIKNSEDVQ